MGFEPTVKRRGKASKQRAYEKFISKVNEMDSRAFYASIALRYNLDEADAIRADSQLMQQIDYFQRQQESRRPKTILKMHDAVEDYPQLFEDVLEDIVEVALPVTADELIGIVRAENPPSAIIEADEVIKTTVVLQTPPLEFSDVYQNQEPDLNVSDCVQCGFKVVPNYHGPYTQLSKSEFSLSPTHYVRTPLDDRVFQAGGAYGPLRPKGPILRCWFCSFYMRNCPSIYNQAPLNYARASHPPKLFSLLLNGLGRGFGITVNVRPDHYVVRWILSKDVNFIRFADNDLYHIQIHRSCHRLRIVFRLLSRSPCLT